MLTIGYGDFTPQTLIERAFGIIFIIANTIVCGYSLNQVGQIFVILKIFKLLFEMLLIILKNEMNEDDKKKNQLLSQVNK